MNQSKSLIIALLILGVLLAVALLVWRDPFDRGSRPDYSGLLRLIGRRTASTGLR